ncbi:MAG: FGGY family carbohydrate kinase [Microscillaceae bacterium]|nr:FGGY family carbohydrate kinase [Microscillaceae bacterium]MDW8460865.1 FGGY family carbohydrate kinase [Cytophagales bacterium]
MKTPVTAVFDIGNINKKLVLFDEQFQVVHIYSARCEKVQDDDGFPADDLQFIKQWAIDTWNELLADSRFQVKALNFTTYGATLMHIDEQGNDVTPLYSYLKEFPKDLHEQFHATYGNPLDFALETCSPPLGMLNSGLQIYWLKYKKPHLFERIRYTLHFPQYMAHLFTGKVTTEYTSIGCHTAMWNFKKRDYHQWIKDEGIINILPDFATSPVIDYKEYNGVQIPIGTGIHDSSSSLRTYLYMLEKSFLLLSFTGTWCITLNPFEYAPLKPEDLLRDCLLYMTVQGRGIRSARFFLGNEHAYQTERMAKHFDKPIDYFKSVKFDFDLFEKAQAEEDNLDKKLKPHFFTEEGTIKKEETTEDWNLSVFENYEEAYHRFFFDMVMYLKPSIDITVKKRFPENIVVDGGYAKNEVFLNTLKEIYNEATILVADIPEGIAIGAALFINQYLNPQMPKPNLKFVKI